MSNAADRSSRKSAAMSPESSAVRMSESTQAMTVSVEQNARYADLWSGSSLLSDRYAVSWLVTNLSSNLEITFKFETGL